MEQGLQLYSSGELSWKQILKDSQEVKKTQLQIVKELEYDESKGIERLVRTIARKLTGSSHQTLKGLYDRQTQNVIAISSSVDSLLQEVGGHAKKLEDVTYGCNDMLRSRHETAITARNLANEKRDAYAQALERYNGADPDELEIYDRREAYWDARNSSWEQDILERGLKRTEARTTHIMNLADNTYQAAMYAKDKLTALSIDYQSARAILEHIVPSILVIRDIIKTAEGLCGMQKQLNLSISAAIDVQTEILRANHSTRPIININKESSTPSIDQYISRRGRHGHR